MAWFEWRIQKDTFFVGCCSEVEPNATRSAQFQSSIDPDPVGHQYIKALIGQSHALPGLKCFYLDTLTGQISNGDHSVAIADRQGQDRQTDRLVMTAHNIRAQTDRRTYSPVDLSLG